MRNSLPVVFLALALLGLPATSFAQCGGDGQRSDEKAAAREELCHGGWAHRMKCAMLASGSGRCAGRDNRPMLATPAFGPPHDAISGCPLCHGAGGVPQRKIIGP